MPFYFSTSVISHAEMSAIEIDTFNNQMLTKLSATNYFEFKEISSKGELKACSLEFGYVYRNYVKFSGNIVQLAGSFNQWYTKGKVNSYTLKLVAKLIDVKANSIDFINPKFLDLVISDTSIMKYKILEQESDNRSLFLGYNDKVFEIGEKIANGHLMHSQMKFSFSENGLDEELKFSDITTKSDSEREISKFQSCSLKILDKIAKDIEALK
jgi:hypothetical protein